MRIIKKEGRAFPESIFLRFSYDPDIVQKLKKCEKRHFHSDTKEWEFPEWYEPVIRKEFAKELSMTEIGEPIELEPIEVDLNLGKVPENYVLKVPLLEHQMIAIQYAQTHDKFLLGDSMGLGKTGVAITISANKNIKHCLIICGVNSIKWNWKNEIEKFSYKDSRFLGQKVNKKGQIKIGENKDKIKDLENFDEVKEFYIITNIESLQNEKISNKLIELCQKGEIGMIILDEAHKCCNPEAKRTEALLALNTKYKLAMTGTPLMNNPLDLYTILKWLDVEKRSYWAFRSEYLITKNAERIDPKTGRRYPFKKPFAYINLDVLQRKLSTIMLRRLKQDVLNLPEKLFIDEIVEMEKDQNDLYKSILEEVLPELENAKTMQNALTQMLKLRQVTSAANSIVPECSCAKLTRAEELVDEAVANNDSVVIFSNWTTVTNIIYKKLSRYNPALITGKVEINKRNEEEKRFQNGETKVLIGTCGAMGTGLNFTKGSIVIFIDEPWTMATKEQNVDRCHRIGQTKNVTVYTLITKDTVDEKVHQILLTKGDLSKALVDTSCIRQILNN